MSALSRTPAGTLRPSHVGQTVRLQGWVNRRRDHGELVFIDLRDRSGLAQVVFDAEFLPEAAVLALAKELRSEFVVDVTGAVMARGADAVNPDLPTGGIEVRATALAILNRAETPPFPIEDGIKASEDLRLKYRYLDLRRPEMTQRFVARSAVTMAIREVLARGGLPRRRDADPHEVDARGRARLPRAVAHPRGRVLRPPAVAAALQADPHGGGNGALLPDRALLPRRGPARRPPAGVHAGRHRDVVPDGGDGLRARREDLHARLPEVGHRLRGALQADDVRRGDGALRHRPAGHAVRAGTGQFRRTSKRRFLRRWKESRVCACPAAPRFPASASTTSRRGRGRRVWTGSSG